MLSIDLSNAYYTSSAQSVLWDCKLRLEAGEFVVLIGANGCGKSTLLKCLAGLHAGMNGAVELGEKKLQQWSLVERAHQIAYLPQSVSPGFSYTAQEVILLSRYHRADQDSAEDQVRRLQAVAAKLEITTLLDSAVDEISGGEWQRVAIARAVMQDAQFLLLDEPTAHLDLSHRLALFQHCQQWASEGKGILCATHDLDAALEYADRIVVLNEGGVESNGAPEQVITEALIQRVFGDTCVEILENPLSQRPQLVIDSRDKKGDE